MSEPYAKIFHYILKSGLFVLVLGCSSSAVLDDAEHGSGREGESEINKKLLNAQTAAQSPANEANTIGLSWPIQTGEITQGFDPTRRRRPHMGIDIGAPRKTQIIAAHNGVVVYAGSSFKGYGKMVMIEFADRWATLYAHLSKILVREGQKIHRGETIGIIGRTGKATGVHLHFEIRYNRQAIDPYRYLPLTPPYIAYYH